MSSGFFLSLYVGNRATARERAGAGSGARCACRALAAEQGRRVLKRRCVVSAMLRFCAMCTVIHERVPPPPPQVHPAGQALAGGGQRGERGGGGRGGGGGRRALWAPGARAGRARGRLPGVAGMKQAWLRLAFIHSAACPEHAPTAECTPNKSRLPITKASTTHHGLQVAELTIDRQLLHQLVAAGARWPWGPLHLCMALWLRPKPVPHTCTCLPSLQLALPAPPRLASPPASQAPRASPPTTLTPRCAST